jgi:hypothetical protein
MIENEELLDGARAAYLAARGEADLIPIKEAATMVDRTVPTLKKWIKKGELDGEQEDEDNPRSRMLVSRKALMLLMATAGKSTNPPRPKATAKTGPAKAVVQAELAGSQALVEALQTQLDLVGAQISAIEEAKRSEQRRADDWKDRAEGLQAELKASRMLAGLPWWKKLLTTTAPPEGV